MNLALYVVLFCHWDVQRTKKTTKEDWRSVRGIEKEKGPNQSKLVGAELPAVMLTVIL